MAKIMIKNYKRMIIIFLTLIFITMNSCGKRGSLERPPLDGNLEPAEVEKNY
jgi:predicted small lipoprotein YifL